MRGIEKEIDGLGRVVLPMEFRKSLGLGKKATVNIRLENNMLLLTPKNACCALCGGIADKNSGFCLCSACIQQIRSK